MEQLFWQSNGNVCLGFGSLADNFLLFEHRQKSQEFTEIPFGQFRLNSNLRFLAKNSNARYTKSLRVSEKTVPSFLAKISNASYKSRENYNYCRGLIYQTRKNGLNKLSPYSAVSK